jgi:hypothetical protein
LRKIRRVGKHMRFSLQFGDMSDSSPSPFLDA